MRNILIASFRSLRALQTRHASTAATSPSTAGVRTSLIQETLAEMEADPIAQTTIRDLKALGQKKLTLEERKKRRRSLDPNVVPSFNEFIKARGCTLNRLPTTIFQMNIGLYCNQACNHCHVESSPKRVEQMSFEVAERCISIIKKSPTVTCVDITGGAPELNPTFRYIVEESRKLGLEVSNPNKKIYSAFNGDHFLYCV